jgi:hypothetical protein
MNLSIFFSVLSLDRLIDLKMDTIIQQTRAIIELRMKTPMPENIQSVLLMMISFISYNAWLSRGPH